VYSIYGVGIAGGFSAPDAGVINPLTPTVAIWVQHDRVPDRVKPSFVNWHPGTMTPAHGWASECPDVKNYKWRFLSPVRHRMLYSCSHMATVGVKGLSWSTCITLRYVNLLLPEHFFHRSIIINMISFQFRLLFWKLSPIHTPHHARSHVVVESVLYAVMTSVLFVYCRHRRLACIRHRAPLLVRGGTIILVRAMDSFACGRAIRTQPNTVVSIWFLSVVVVFSARSLLYWVQGVAPHYTDYREASYRKISRPTLQSVYSRYSMTQ